MKAKSLRIAVLTAAMTTLAGCAATPPAPEPPPPPQNLVGATDELQLVTELALDQARTYGAERILVVLDIDNTLLAMEQGLGSDQWYYWQKDLSAEDPCSPQLVSNRFAASVEARSSARNPSRSAGLHSPIPTGFTLRLPTIHAHSTRSLFFSLTMEAASAARQSPNSNPS